MFVLRERETEYSARNFQLHIQLDNNTLVTNNGHYSYSNQKKESESRSSNVAMDEKANMSKTKNGIQRDRIQRQQMDITNKDTR